MLLKSMLKFSQALYCSDGIIAFGISIILLLPLSEGKEDGVFKLFSLLLPDSDEVRL
jgi:hypothetical protein